MKGAPLFLVASSRSMDAKSTFEISNQLKTATKTSDLQEMKPPSRLYCVSPEGSSLIAIFRHQPKEIFDRDMGQV
jgi:hypothetical protein